KAVYVPVTWSSSSKLATTVNEHVWDCEANNVRAIAGSPAVPDRVPPLLLAGFEKVNCQVPFTFVSVWENVKRAVPVPTTLSWIVPVHVPVRLGSSPPEQPSRAKIRT